MGKGKGPRRGFKGLIKKGMIIFEFYTPLVEKADFVLNQCSNRLPIKTKKIKFKV